MSLQNNTYTLGVIIPCWNLSSRIAERLNNSKVGKIVANYNQI